MSPARSRWRVAGFIAAAITATAGAWLTAAAALVPAKAVVAQLLLERAFDHSVASGRPQKPWPWADMTPVARISVPRLRVDRIVLDTGSGQAMAFGPTLMPAGAALGAPGTAVVAAHRDTHFRFLQHVQPGETILVKTAQGATFRYRVTGSEVVRWNGFAIAEASGRRELVLSTCYPFDAIARGPLRYVVHARKIA